MKISSAIKQTSAQTVASLVLMTFLLPLLPIAVLSWICFLFHSVSAGAQK